MPRFGKKSIANLRGVNIKLVNVLNQAIKHFDFTVIEGMRSLETQTQYAVSYTHLTLPTILRV